MVSALVGGGISGVVILVILWRVRRRRGRLRWFRHLQRPGGESLVELLRGVRRELCAGTEGPVQLPRVV